MKLFIKRKPRQCYWLGTIKDITVSELSRMKGKYIKSEKFRRAIHGKFGIVKIAWMIVSNFILSDIQEI